MCARLRSALVGLDPTGPLVVKTVAEPAAERRPEYEADGTARGRADHGAAAETDRLLLGDDTRLVLRGTVPRPCKARRREQAADDQDNEFLLHGSLLKRKVGGHGRYCSETGLRAGEPLPQETGGNLDNYGGRVGPVSRCGGG